MLTAVTLAIALVLSTTSSVAKIPLNRCCYEDELYILGMDHCESIENGTLRWPPPVHSISGKKTVFRPDDFDVTERMPNCPEGYVKRIWTEFRLEENGSLQVQNKSYDPKSFCINQIPTFGKGDPIFAARVCVPDPCIGTKCISKCCPKGFSLSDNNSSSICQSSKTSISFNVNSLKLHDQNGNRVERDSDILIQYGTTPDCDFRFLDSDQTFYVLGDGRLFSPLFLVGHQYKNHEEYCIDNEFSAGSKNTILSALVCFSNKEESETLDSEKTLRNCYSYFLFISSIFSMATLIVYALLPDLRNIHGKSVMGLAASMTVMFIGSGLLWLVSRSNQLSCPAFAILIHYAFLSTFTWLNVMSFDIWWTFNDLRPVSSSRYGRELTGRRFTFYSVYAWLVPLAIVLTGVIIDNIKNDFLIKPEYKLANNWWFGSRKSMRVYFYIPMTILILSNIFFFICN